MRTISTSPSRHRTECTDPGLRLLPEFDGLLVGYHGRNRIRFLTEQQLPKVWAKVNGLFSPVVLYDGRLVASWKTITKGRRTDIEVSMLDPHPRLADDLFADAIAATEQVARHHDHRPAGPGPATLSLICWTAIERSTRG